MLCVTLTTIDHIDIIDVKSNLLPCLPEKINLTS